VYTEPCSTGPAQDITSRSAALTGDIYPYGMIGQWYFEYGTDISYGSKTSYESYNPATGHITVYVPIDSLTPNTIYHFRIRFDVFYGYDETFQTTQDVGINEKKYFVANGFELSQNYPNPFNPATNISFILPKRSFVSLKVYDLVGRAVATIASEELSAGNYTRQWNATNIPSGVYFYRLQAGTFFETKKLVLIR
jgi:hypothetical protein